MSENSRDVELRASMDATGVRAGVEQAKTALGDLANAAQREGAKAGAGIERAGDGADRAGQKIERETRSMIGSIERATAAFKAGQKGGADYFEALAKQRGVSADTLKPYLDQLRQAEAAQKAATGGLNAMGVSAAQTAAALRQVPAQFTDIITALASGQQPLTVFLQQGGQLKDAFGGAGNAARALGGYVAGLVNPLTLAGAAAAGLGAAFLAGQAESQAFARALIISGNAAGETTGRLTQLAAAQATLVGTQGQAAEALAALAGTGKVARDVLDEASEAVTRLARVGQPLEDTVKKFASLGKEPLKALIDLNEAENFLTISVYKQVKALEEQGRVAEAASVAQAEYARVGIQRAKELEAGLGTLQKAWKGVGDVAREAWDKMLGVGRGETPEKKLAVLEEQIRATEAKIAAARDGSLKDRRPYVDAERIAAAQERLLASLKGQAEAQKEVIRLAERSAATRAAEAAAVKGLVEADKEAAKISRDAAAQRDRDNAALETAVGLTGSYQKDLAELNRLRQRNLLTEQQYVKAVEELIKAQPVVREQIEAQTKAQKEAAKALDDLLKAELQRVEQQSKAAAQVQEQVQKLRDEEQALGIAAEQNIGLAAAIEQVRIARLQEARARAAAAGDAAMREALQAEINARKELAGLIDAKAGREEARKSADDAAREWKRASDDIERTLTDALMRGFESGKGFAETLRDTVVNMFKTLVLRPVIQAAVQPLVGSLQGLVGTSGLGGVAGGLGGLGSVFGYGNTGIGGGLGGLGGNADPMSLITGGGGASSLGQYLGYGAALYGLSQGQYGSAAGTAIGTAIAGPIGAAIGGTIGKGLDKLFGGAGTHHSGAGFVSNGTTGTSVKDAAYGLGGAYGDSVGKYFNAGIEDALKTITGRAAAVLNGFSAAFGGAGGYQVGGYFASDNNRGSNFGRSVLLNGSVISEAHGNNLNKDPSLGLQELADDIAGQVRSVMQQIDLPEWARTQLSALGSDVTFDQLTQAVASITATMTALEQLGAVMPQLAGASDAALAAILQQAGGVDNLKAITANYFDNFYTDAEKTAQATSQLSKALGDLGFSMPASREAYRALVEAQDKNTEAGQKAWLQLQALSPAFAALVPATEQLGQVADGSAAAMQRAAEQMAAAGRRVLADLADQQGALQVELLRAQGNVQAAAEQERARAIAKLSEGLSAADVAAATAAYDFNAALRQQIEALNAAKTAAEQAAQAEEQRAAAEQQRVLAISQQRTSLEDRLLQQLGDTATLRQRELAGVDVSNRAILERIYALQDEASAEQQASQAIEAARQRAAAVLSERSGLERQLLQAQGDTAGLRALELAALDASNRPLLERIYALQDERDAAATAAQAARELQSAQQAAAEAEARRIGAIANERDGLTVRLLQAQGDTAALRQHELDALDPSNRAILQRIFAIEDERDAAQRSTQAQAEAAQAAAESARQAEQLRQAWQTVTDGIFAEVQRIRGLDAAGNPGTLAAAQARFAVATAQARAGDQGAAKLLPSLSQTLLDLVGASASSLLDIQRIRAQVAASLEQTGGTLTGRFGLAVPKFDVGTNYVPRDMLAMVHEGEAIVPRAFNPAAGGGAAGNAALAAEIRGLRDENKAQALAIVKLQTEIAKLLRKWDGEGLPEERVVA